MFIQSTLSTFVNIYTVIMASFLNYLKCLLANASISYLFIMMLSTERPECFRSYFAVGLYPMFLLIIWVYFTVHICAFFKINESI